MKCPELVAELFAWFVDSIANIKGRMPSSLLLQVARCFAKDLGQWHAEQQEHGRVAPHEKLVLPIINHAWLRRWRRLCGVSWRAVNLRFKAPEEVVDFFGKHIASSVLAPGLGA